MDIASMLEVQVSEVNDGKEVELKENVTPGAAFSRALSPPLKPYSQAENEFFKMMYGSGVRDWRSGYSAAAISKIESAIAAYKKGTYTLSDACKKYRIPEEHFRVCLEETNYQEAENGLIKLANVTGQASLEQKNVLEEENLRNLENIIGQATLLELGNLEGLENEIEEIVVEEEIIIEDLIEENDIDTESKGNIKSKKLSQVCQQWTEEDMHVALNAYTKKECTYNEACAKFGIPKKEFKKQLLAYEEYKEKEKICERKGESCEISTNFEIKNEQEDEFVSEVDPQHVLPQIEKEVVTPSCTRVTDTKDDLAKIEAEKKLATYIINLQEGMFDLKAIEFKILAFQLFKYYNVSHKFLGQKSEAGTTWLLSFLAKNPQINTPPIANSLLTNEYVWKRTNEHFEALERVYTKYNIHSSRIYNVEISKFSNKITLVYCTNAVGVYICPIIILTESEEANNLLKQPELFDKYVITISASGTFTPGIFVMWLRLFIGEVHPTSDHKVVLCLDENNTKCKSLRSLELAHDNGIILMQVPTSGSVRMQPLMMTFVREMHYHYTKQVDGWCLTSFEGSVSLKRSIEILLNVYRTSATIKNAVEGFQKVGMWPLNKNLFLGVILGTANENSQVTEGPSGTRENSSEKLEERSLLTSQEFLKLEFTEGETTEMRNLEIKKRDMNSTLEKDVKIDTVEVQTREVNRTEVETTEAENTELGTRGTETESEEIKTIQTNLNNLEKFNECSTASTDIYKKENQEDMQQQTREKTEEESHEKSKNTTNLSTTVTPISKQNKSDEFLSISNVQNSVESSEVYSDFTRDLPSVRFCKIHCTACDVHIGSAPSQITNMFEHPKLRTLLCSKCYEFYGDGDFEQGDDQTDMFCRWCANGGNLYCCSYCSNTFCAKCIKRNFAAVVAKKIEADENWKCFVCDETDLYPARSLCRAIIQHVQTVSRILQSDKSMTAAQIYEKMNLDEARCCIRKRKRKRRRTGSCSEDEDDETYTPVLSEVPQAKKRRTRKSSAYSTIRTNGSINNQSEDENSLLGGENDLLPAMLACEQTMTEGETALPFGPPPPPLKTLPPPLKTLPPPPLAYTNNSVINPIPTVNLLKPVQVRKLNPVSPLSQTPRPMLIQKRPNRPMVSIPQPKPPPPQLQLQQARARVLIPKARPQNRSDNAAPNIIDLDSDSDEAIEVIAEASRSPQKNKTQQNKEDSEVSEVSKIRDKTFEQMILDQKEDIEQALQTLRKKFNTILSPSQDEVQRTTHRNAALKMKQFQQVMRKAIYRLAQINDRVVREYQSWRKQQSAERNENPERTKVDFQPTKSPDVDLEMTCVRDSASESEADYEDKSEETILEVSNLEVDQLDCYKNLTLFRKKVTVEQGVGEDSVRKEDKSVQVYDIHQRDYEKSVGYSLLMKADYDSKTNKEVLKPVAVPSEHFGKFQEQYIYHLQHIEDNGIKTDDDLDELPDPNETPLKDLIEANSPFIAEMLENIAPAVTNGSSSVETEMIVDETPPDKENLSEEVSAVHQADPTVATSKAVEELVKMVTKLSDELKSTNNSPENSALSPEEINDESEETSKKEKTKTNDESKDEETVVAVRTLIEEESSNSNDFSEPRGGTQAMEEECSFLN